MPLVRGPKNQKMRPGPAMVLCWDRNSFLHVRVVMMVVATMVMAGRKHRAGKHQQKQGNCEDLFHATNVT
jgi:hypothetical protein